MIAPELLLDELRSVAQAGSVWLGHGRIGTPLRELAQRALVRVCATTPVSEGTWASTGGAGGPGAYGGSGDYYELSADGRDVLYLPTDAALAALRLRNGAT